MSDPDPFFCLKGRNRIRNSARSLNKLGVKLGLPGMGKGNGGGMRGREFKVREEGKA